MKMKREKKKKKQGVILDQGSYIYFACFSFFFKPKTSIIPNRKGTLQPNDKLIVCIPK